MNMLFLGCLYSEHLKATYKLMSKRGYQFAAQNLQESLIEGFIQNGVNISVLTIPSLSTFPRSYKRPIVCNDHYYFRGQRLGKTIGYINMPLNRVFFKGSEEFIKQWYENSGKDKFVFVYGMHKKIMQIALAAKKKYPDITLSIIVPDLPKYFGWNKYLKFLKQDIRAIKELNELIYGFQRVVVLSKYMLDDLNLNSGCRTTVMEGIFTPETDLPIVDKEFAKTILYTGNISKRYGIEQLLDAFKLIDDSNYRLWIRGNGDMFDIIKEHMSKDKRIVYFEPMSKRDLLVLQKKATILVNPVSDKQEFTKYFFPSKTMDYLASGTPTIMYPLKCLPEEYNNHLMFFKGISNTEMARDLMNACSLDSEALKAMGINAQCFILAEKNSKVQVRKIVELLQK